MKEEYDPNFQDLIDRIERGLKLLETELETRYSAANYFDQERDIGRLQGKVEGFKVILDYVRAYKKKN